MNSYRKKLIASGIFLTLAVLTLVGASLAWFTISTRPEIGGLQVSLYANRALLISDSIDGEYGQLLDMDDQLSKYVELRPVSTADGVNWFLPTYEASGPLKDPSEFILDDDLTHANILSCAQDGTPLEGAALIAAREKGFYVYTEFYMKTEEEQCDVRLSIPASTSLESWETAQGTYGTYALASYDLDGQNLAVMDSQSQTALRVGFLTEMGTPSQRFAIYEPNADERSASGKPESTEEDSAERYVVGYDKSNTNYLDGYYIPTNPIGLGGSGAGELTGIDSANLIIQQKSSWDTDALKQALIDGRSPGSNEVATMGRFVADNPALMSVLNADTNMALIGSNTAISGGTVILHLTKDSPQKVRMFIWIEGQDVDCWNDVAAGSFIINLELAGETD